MTFYLLVIIVAIAEVSPLKEPSSFGAIHADKTVETNVSPVTAPSVPGGIPENVTYLIVGAGTAAFAAYRSIRANDPKAQVF